MSEPDTIIAQDSSSHFARRIEAICCQLERQWRDKQIPRIEELLDQIPTDVRARGLCELIAVEVNMKRAAGEDVAIEAYLARFQDHEPVVREAFALVARDAVPDNRDVATVSFQAAPESWPEGDQKPGPPAPNPPLRFRLERELGRGSFGIVYLATDTQLPQQVALKFPRDERFKNESDRRRFIRDAQHAVRLKHPGIVTVYDVRNDGGQVCVVQEYMPGGDLAQRLKAGALTCQQAVAWMIPIAEAIAFAHQHDTFHRDLKPANILLDERGQPRVSDFGLALQEDEQLQHRNQLAGTAPYMSPEQVRRESHRLDGRSDTWSLGVIFYEMLTGRRPFRGTEEELF